MKNPVIALLTDFGVRDFFVASVKAVILKINPQVQIIDISHEIPSFDTVAAGFVLKASHAYFPSGTIFLAVVDPGVGTSRRILAAECGDWIFIGPDNGILDQVLAGNHDSRIWEVSDSRYFLPKLGRTFDGRDKMAPVAAWISKGVPCEKLGPPAVYSNEGREIKPSEEEDTVSGQIVYADKFGNLITNISEDSACRMSRPALQGEIVLHAGTHAIRLGESYQSVERGAPVLLVGSLGYLEIACREASAAEILNLKPGDPVVLSSVHQP